MTVRWLTAFIDRPTADLPAAVAFWTRVTGSVLSPARGERGEFTTLLPPDGDPYLRVQEVLAGPGGAHLDVHVADVEGEADRAVRLGATAFPQDGYVTLESPAGLRWCLVPDGGRAPDSGPARRRPAPVRRDCGDTCLVDQLCLDVPPGSYEDECAFWHELTEWRLKDASRPEFRYLARPAGMPLRLLLQRLDESPADGRATCHLDLACTDRAAETARHESWGARVLARRRWWTTLADPAGSVYCLTHRDPSTGTTPAPGALPPS